MFDHLGLGISDCAASKAFFAALVASPFAALIVSCNLKGACW